jgi:hypothetical protein
MSTHAANENARQVGSVLCVATAGHNEDRLRGLIKASSWMMRVLATAGEVGPPDAWVGAGVVRDLVWGQLYGSGFEPGRVHDIDVVFFDPDDLRRSVDEQATRRLGGLSPLAVIDVVRLFVACGQAATAKDPAHEDHDRHRKSEHSDEQEPVDHGVHGSPPWTLDTGVFYVRIGAAQGSSDAAAGRWSKISVTRARSPLGHVARPPRHSNGGIHGRHRLASVSFSTVE